MVPKRTQYVRWSFFLIISSCWCEARNIGIFSACSHHLKPSGGHSQDTQHTPAISGPGNEVKLVPHQEGCWRSMAPDWGANKLTKLDKEFTYYCEAISETICTFWWYAREQNTNLQRWATCSFLGWGFHLFRSYLRYEQKRFQVLNLPRPSPGLRLTCGIPPNRNCLGAVPIKSWRFSFQEWIKNVNETKPDLRCTLNLTQGTNVFKKTNICWSLEPAELNTWNHFSTIL